MAWCVSGSWIFCYIITFHSGLKPKSAWLKKKHTHIKKKHVMWVLSGETDLRAWPAVGIARPQQSDQVEAEESAQQCQHYIVLRHRGKQLCRTRNVHLVWHHKEGAPKESEVVTQTLSQLRSAFLSHLRQRKQVTVWEVNTGASSTLLQSNAATDFLLVK